MTFADYQEQAAQFAVYPKDREREYLALGLISEVGELAGKLKKEIRDGVDLTEAILDEISDVMWYVSQLCRRHEIEESLDPDIRHMIHKDSDSEVALDAMFHACMLREADIHEILCCMQWLCEGRNTTLEAVCERNIAKLQDRKNRDVIKGSGDDR